MGGRRNPLIQPFGVNSIWNTPISKNAQYVFGAIPVDESTDGFRRMAPDLNIILYGGRDTPAQPVYKTDIGFGIDLPPGDPGPVSGEHRCAAITSQVYTNSVVPQDFKTIGNPLRTAIGGNNACALYQGDATDPTKIIQVNPVEVCSLGGPMVSRFYDPNITVDINGDGIIGGGAAKMSTVGGSIRPHELLPGGRIAHVIQMNLFGKSTLFYDEVHHGFRWPASRADGYAGEEGHPWAYGGTVPEARMGSLFALLPTFDMTQIKTVPGQIIARALLEFGAYCVDDTTRNALSFNGTITNGPNGPDGYSTESVFFDAYGWNMDVTRQAASTPDEINWVDDMIALFGSMYVVDNNDADNIGGGPNGEPESNRLAPYAFPIDPNWDRQPMGMAGVVNRSASNPMKAGMVTVP